MKVSCRINGETVSAEVEPRLLLSDFLRDHQRLTGTHVGCEIGICGACTVMVDGKAIRSCLVFAGQLTGADIVTVEGLGKDGQLDRLQLEFHRHHALQCGFCTPGVLMTCVAARQAGILPRDEEAVRELLSGTICRCTGYQPIVDAILAASE